METIQMTETHEVEVLHLFGVMQRHGVKCSMELQAGLRSPLLGISDAQVRTEYIEGTSGDSLVVYLDEAEFGFEVGSCSYAKYIGDSQIEIAIAGPRFVAFFNSESMIPEAIEEAKNYKEPIDTTTLEFIVNVRDEGEGAAQTLETIAKLIRSGMEICQIEDAVDLGGYYRFVLDQPEED